MSVHIFILYAIRYVIFNWCCASGNVPDASPARAATKAVVNCILIYGFGNFVKLVDQSSDRMVEVNFKPERL